LAGFQVSIIGRFWVSTEGIMRGFFVILTALCLWTPVLADDGPSKEVGKAPLMQSFTDLKWTELPERKGMQFAVLSGDPKQGGTRRCARFQPELTTRCTCTAVNSRT
jgi:hypothetical protein